MALQQKELSDIFKVSRKVKKKGLYFKFLTFFKRIFRFA